MLGLADAIGENGPHWAESALRIGVGITACTILLMAIATSFSGCGRLAEAMGRHRPAPAGIRADEPPGAGAAGGDPLGLGARDRLHRRRVALLATEETLTLASLYTFGILIAFMLTQAAIVWLRIVEPDLPRPFMMKGNVWIGRRLIPVTSVVGACSRSSRGWSRSGRTPAPGSSARCGWSAGS